MQPIEDLLKEIEKFKSNISNSNQLMDFLEKTTQEIREQKDNLEQSKLEFIEHLDAKYQDIIEQMENYNRKQNEEFSSLNKMIKLMSDGISFLKDHGKDTQKKINLIIGSASVLIVLNFILLIISIISLVKK